MSTTLNLEEASKFLKLGYEATRELFERGEIPGASLNQKHVVFLLSDLEMYIRDTAKRQAAERRQGIKPVDHAAAGKRPRQRGQLPNLEAAEAQANASATPAPGKAA